jgi:predicted nucleotidyltransferase
MKFGLTSEEFKILEEILFKPLKVHSARVWIFGSRARGDQKKFSDIDVLYSLKEEESLPSGLLFEIKDRLENSDLPYKVDLVEEKDLAKSYRENVLRDRVEVSPR